jgi:predicted RNase H-like nuclease (RuvC/YqgF family)
MAFLGLILLIALMIPVMGMIIDSPIGKALARRLEGPEATAPNLVELAREVEVLRGEVDDLQRSVQALQEENQFLQRLLEEKPAAPALPPSKKP